MIKWYHIIILALNSVTKSPSWRKFECTAFFISKICLFKILLCRKLKSWSPQNHISDFARMRLCHFDHYDMQRWAQYQLGFTSQLSLLILRSCHGIYIHVRRTCTWKKSFCLRYQGNFTIISFHISFVIYCHAI
jgi:hypothetical protein